MNDLILPPWNPAPSICPRCRNSTWSCTRETPLESKQYSQTIYEEHIQCGYCDFFQDILRPCMPKPDEQHQKDQINSDKQMEKLK